MILMNFEGNYKYCSHILSFHIFFSNICTHHLYFETRCGPTKARGSNRV
jgi:hypothetical protein